MIGQAPALDRWMLPGALVQVVDGGTTARSPRDWAVDVAFSLVAAAVFVAELSTTVVDNAYGLPMWLRIADPVLGAVACLALWWRRRFPLALGAGAAVVGALSNTAAGATLLLLFSLALHRGWPQALPVAAAGALLGLPYVLGYLPDPWLTYVVVVLLIGLLVTAGLAVRARRQLVVVLQARAERDYARRLQAGRRDERERIAREMHDTLAHRISLLSVHAGALEYRTQQAETAAAPPLTAAEIRAAVAVIRDNAHHAVAELGEVLHVLRGPAADEPAPPGLDRLLAEARSSGQRVTAHVDGDPAALRPQLQRTIHRTVQEGLTNARKHAPGAEVTLTVRAAPGDAVTVEIANAVSTHPAGSAGCRPPVPTHPAGSAGCRPPVQPGVSTGVPGTGSGLAGLAERVELLGGELTCGVRGGEFRLRAELGAS